MKIIVPMAGRGTRLRPHTHTVPKPLLPIAGKPIVQRLVEDIAALIPGKIEEIVYIIGDFGKAAEDKLHEIGKNLGIKTQIVYQEEALGTAHAIWMAESSLNGEVVIAFADTLFRADFQLDQSKDGVIWVKTVSNPESFGVVTLNEDGIINAMVEKPKEFVSDLAIIGIYYVKDGNWLREEIKHLIDNDLREKGEYQLTNALENMKSKGGKFIPGEVKDWMDCGNKAAVLDTNQKVLDYDTMAKKQLVSGSLSQKNSTIISPCFIGENVDLENCIIGPYVSVGNNTTIKNSVVKKSVIQEGARIENSVLSDSMVGNFSEIAKTAEILDLGDHSRINK